MTEDMKEELRQDKVTKFEVAEFIKDKTENLTSKKSGRNCSLVAVNRRVVDFLKADEDLQEYGVIPYALDELITVVPDDDFFNDCYQIILTDIEGRNVVIGVWWDNTEQLFFYKPSGLYGKLKSQGGRENNARKG